MLKGAFCLDKTKCSQKINIIIYKSIENYTKMV